MPLLSPLNPPMADWSGKTVWMIGASTGIGRATASALHQRGARVFVSARSAAPLDAFVAQHPGAIAVPVQTAEESGSNTHNIHPSPDITSPPRAAMPV